MLEGIKPYKLWSLKQYLSKLDTLREGCLIGISQGFCQFKKKQRVKKLSRSGVSLLMRALLSWAGQWVQSSVGRQALKPVASLTLKNDAKTLPFKQRGGESFLAVASCWQFYEVVAHLLMKNKHWLLCAVSRKYQREPPQKYILLGHELRAGASSLAGFFFMWNVMIAGEPI